MEINIGKLYLEIRDNGNSALCSDIVGCGKKFTLWYEVTAEFAQYLCTERADAFVVSLLPWAMMNAIDGDPIEVICSTPISSKLYHQLINYYIPTLSTNISYYSPVMIRSEIAHEQLPSSGAVGTGISGGVDSSYTIAKYMDYPDTEFQLTYGVFYNIGIYDGMDSVSEKLLEDRARAICDDCGLNFFILKTNTCLELYGKAHAPIVPCVFMGATLALQKLFSIYYYSSGFSAADFELNEADAAYYDLFNVHCLSTKNTMFYSSGVELTRLQKVEYIADSPFTYDTLSVCLNTKQENGNCGRCAKCTRTMAELESIGKLDNYSNVFDVQAFRAAPGYHWGYVLLKSRNDSFCGEIIKRYRANGRKMPISAYTSCIRKWISRGFTTENRKREKVKK